MNLSNLGTSQEETRTIIRALLFIVMCFVPRSTLEWTFSTMFLKEFCAGGEEAIAYGNNEMWPLNRKMAKPGTCKILSFHRGIETIMSNYRIHSICQAFFPPKLWKLKYCGNEAQYFRHVVVHTWSHDNSSHQSRTWRTSLPEHSFSFLELV